MPMPNALNVPGFWQNETSGVLRPVITAYLNGKRLSAHDLRIMREYLLQWIDAPVWAVDEDIQELRRSVRQIHNQKDIDDWLDAAISAGIDPL